MTAFHCFKDGDKARIRVGDVNTPAVIALASPNGFSLMVEFDGTLEGHDGLVPLFWNAEGQGFFTLGGRKPFVVSPA